MQLNDLPGTPSTSQSVSQSLLGRLLCLIISGSVVVVVVVVVVRIAASLAGERHDQTGIQVT